MSDNGFRYRRAPSTLVVTKPTGEVVVREMVLSFDRTLQMFEVVFVGDSPLKGYVFGILQSELKRVRDQGEPKDELPKPS